MYVISSGPDGKGMYYIEITLNGRRVFGPVYFWLREEKQYKEQLAAAKRLVGEANSWKAALIETEALNGE
jgi:hypothetical protein